MKIKLNKIKVVMSDGEEYTHYYQDKNHLPQGQDKYKYRIRLSIENWKTGIIWGMRNWKDGDVTGINIEFKKHDEELKI